MWPEPVVLTIDSVFTNEDQQIEPSVCVRIAKPITKQPSTPWRERGALRRSD